MSLPQGGGPGGLRSPSSDPLRSSPQLLRQLTSPTVGGLPSANTTLESIVPRSSPMGGMSGSPSKPPLLPSLAPRHPGQRSPGPSPARKRLKLDLGTAAAGPTSLKKRKLFEFRTARLRKVTSAYRDNMGELFFLTNGTNVTDNLMSFRRKPTQQFVNFLKASNAPARVISEVQTAVIGQQQNAGNIIGGTVLPNAGSPLPRRPPTAYSPRILPSSVLSPVKVGEQLDVLNSRLAASLARPPASPLALPPISAPIYSAEQVAERVKQEGWVTRRVAELSRDGLWPERRLPRVAERPRALSAWGLVLEEMKWMSADFQQERAWKKAAARVHSSACREHVVRVEEEKQAALLEASSEVHRRGIARRIAAQVQTWWVEVAALQKFDEQERAGILASQQLAQQAAIVTESPHLTSSNGKKRKLEEITGGEDRGAAVGELNDSSHENGVDCGSDSESTISEQEAWEALSCLATDHLVDLEEGKRLEAEASLPLARLCRENYPGYEEDVRERWQEEEEATALSDQEDSDDDSEDGQEEQLDLNLEVLLLDSHRTTKGEGCGVDLAALSTRAAALAPKPVIQPTGPSPSVSPRKPGLEEHQTAGADWLAAMHSNHLPAMLADEQGLGRKATVATFLANLPTIDKARGAMLLVCPVSSLTTWQNVLAQHAPALSLLVYSGPPAQRRRIREELALGRPGQHLLITSYRALFLDSTWFLSRAWTLLIQSEAQNVISAGSSEQLRALVRLRATKQRILVVSGQQKANPIDLWNTVYLLFPGVMRQREDQGEGEVEVEGTQEYQDRVARLQTFVNAFTLARSKTKCASLGGGETRPLWVNLGKKQKALYEDLLAKPATQDCLVQGDLLSVYGLIQQLRSICSPALEKPQQPPSLPSWCILDPPSPSNLFANLFQYDPLENISLDQVNMVFINQELRTTALASCRIRSLKASPALITELPETKTKSGASAAPRNKLAFTLEPVTRAVGGWAVGGLGEGVSLVRAGNGQVYKVGGRAATGKPSLCSAEAKTEVGALHPDSVETIAAMNRWRCDGFPLYGQDLIRSLTITGSARPARSRFCGQGYVNCLTTEAVKEGGDRDGVWKYKTDALASLVRLGHQTSTETKRKVEALMSGCPGHSKLFALANLLAPVARRGEKAVAVAKEDSSVGYLQMVATNSGIRYVLVSHSDPLVDQVAAVERWSKEPRLCLLVLHGLSSQTGLDLSPCKMLVLLDGEPGQWEPTVSSITPTFKLITRGTVEEGLARISTVRRLLSDIEACRMEEGRGVRVGKHTLQELLQPSPNGFTTVNWTTPVTGKKKEKAGLSDSEAVATLAAVWSEVTGSSTTTPSSCLLDLAELETSDRPGQLSCGMGPRAVRLRQWRETLPLTKKLGMQRLRECWEVREGLEGETLMETEGEAERKQKWERKRKAQEDEEVVVPSQEVTFPKELAERIWRSEDGLEPKVYRAPGLGDELMVKPLTSGYATTIIPEDQLPPVHVPRREKKTPPPEGNRVICVPPSPPYLPDNIPYSPSSLGLDTKPKIKREDVHSVPTPKAPSSLFDRPRGTAGRPAIPRRPIHGTPNYPVAGAQGQALQKPVATVREVDHGPEWTIQEDWALYQAVTSLQELPLGLTAPSPGHIANWDMVADMVNAVSRCFRSGKQCRGRYEGSLVPREEGRVLYDVTPKKIKKINKLGMTKPEKKSLTPSSKQVMKTGALFKADNNNAFSNMFSSRFETIKALANKRTPSTKPLLVNPTMRNPKHAAVLAESGISYDSPLTPVMVAANRADRIAKDKLRTAQAAQLAAQPTLTTPALPTQPVAVTQAQVTPARAALATPQPAISSLTPTSVSLPTTPAQAVVVGISQPVQQQQQQQHSTAARPMQQTVTALSMADLLKSSGTATSTVVSAVAAPPGVSTGRPAGQVVITQATLQGKQTGAQTVQRQLTPQQLAALKQQAIKKQIQDQQMKQRQLLAGGAGNSAGGSKGTTMVGTVARGGQLVRTGGTVRSMTEAEVKQLMAKQQLKVGAGGVVQVPAGTSLTHAQLQQLGIQVAGTSLVSSPSTLTPATLVKTVQATNAVAGTSTSRPVTIAGASLAGVNLASGQLKAVGGRGAPITGSPQQLQQLKVQRQLQLFQKQSVGGSQRVALQPVAGGKGLPAQLIVQGQAGGKGLPATVTVQQLQQIVKSVAGGGQGQPTQQIISHAVLAKQGAPGQTVQARVLPVSGVTARQGQQTIQVVAAPQGSVRGSSPSVSLDQLGRPQANALASALAAGNHVKIQAPTGASQQQIISQVSAALASHGQNVSVAVRAPLSGAPALQGAGLLRSVNSQAASSGAPAPVTPAGAGGGGGQQQMVNLQLSVAQPQAQAGGQPQTQVQPQANSAPTTSSNQGGE